MDLKSLENNRLYILKRLGILKFLSIIEALLVGFLAFVFIRDALIAVILAVFVGVFFFRFTAKKLKLAQKELQINALNLFLRRFGAKFKKQSLSQKDFLKLGLTKDLKDGYKDMTLNYIENVMPHFWANDRFIKLQEKLMGFKSEIKT